MLQTILYLIIILVFEKIWDWGIKCVFLIQQIVYITISNHVLFCDGPHCAKIITE